MKLIAALCQTIVLLLSVSLSAQSQSSTALRSTPIGLGQVAPDFTLQDQEGRLVNLSAARAKSPVVLIFYRGYW